MLGRRSAFSTAVACYRKAVANAASLPTFDAIPTLGRSVLTGHRAPTRQSLRSFFFSGKDKGFTADSAEALKELGKYDPEAVIRRFESGTAEQTEAALAEYVKALVRVDRLDSSQLMHTLRQGQVAMNSSTRGAAAAAAAAPGAPAAGGTNIVYVPFTPPGAYAGAAGAAAPSGPLAAAAQAGMGSAAKPMVIAHADPSFKSQLWKTVRTLGGMFILFSVVEAALEQAPGAGSSMAKGLLGGGKEPKPTVVSDTRFADVKGCDEAKGELEELVTYLQSPERFTKLGAKLPKGVLLTGPPGTGKTMLARAVAGEAGVPFFYTSGSEFEEMFVGVGARRVRELFAAAKKAAPCIIFVDEIDAVGGKRNPRNESYSRMTLNQLLAELDGFQKNNGVIVIGATNFVSTLDPALVRPGRFDRQVVVDLPDVNGRAAILEKYLKGVARAPSMGAYTEVLARGTPGWSGADLANMVNFAALRAAQDGKKAVDEACMEWAKDRIMMGMERVTAYHDPENLKLTAYHEAGHAIMALFTGGALPIHKATIVQRGQALGMVQQLPEKDMKSQNYRQLLARLDVCMGGRVAEELIYGPDKVTTGASGDLQQATSMATSMVEKCGFSTVKGLGVVAEGASGATKRKVEEEVQQLLDESYARAKATITQHRDKLEAVAQELLKKKTLTGPELRQIVGLPPLKLDAPAANTAPGEN